MQQLMNLDLRIQLFQTLLNDLLDQLLNVLTSLSKLMFPRKALNGAFLGINSRSSSDCRTDFGAVGNLDLSNTNWPIGCEASPSSRASISSAQFIRTTELGGCAATLVSSGVETAE